MSPFRLIVSLHHPAALAPYSFFDIGRRARYFDDDRTRDEFIRDGQRWYVPFLESLLAMPPANGMPPPVALAISGLFLDLCEQHGPPILALLEQLGAPPARVEYLATPYYNSLAATRSPGEFQAQVRLQRARMASLAGVEPRILLNTGMAFHEHVLPHAAAAGCPVILVPELSDILPRSRLPHRKDLRGGDPTPANPTREAGLTYLELNPRSLQHSGCDSGYSILTHSAEHPMPPHCTTLSTGHDNQGTPPRAAAWISGHAPYDLSPWLGNNLQLDALDALYPLEQKILGTGRPELVERWRKLQDASYLADMATSAPDPTPPRPGSPYDAYIGFMNILTDLSEQVSGLRPPS